MMGANQPKTAVPSLLCTHVCMYMHLCFHSGVLGKVINLCGCTSILELLTGHLGSHDSHKYSHEGHPISPYILMAETTAKTMAISHEVSESGCGLDPATTADTSKDSDESAVKGKEVDYELLFSRGIIKSLLLLLRTKLTRDSWKKQPSAKHAFVWTLRQLKVHANCMY